MEKAGIKIIQVDEPALRDETQIHTHMCYSDFEDIISTISGLDADVISIETSRSHGEIISAFEDAHYDKQIGSGVYDIHSPRIPSVAEIADNIRRGLKVIDHNQFWVNPDCGLKTRNEKQTLEALQNLEDARNLVFSEISSNE